MTYPYVQSQEKLVECLKKLSTIGQPQTFGVQNLKAIGYTSSNDERILSVLKFIGLVEDKKGGSPTELWSELRTDFSSAIAKGVRTGYADLFSIYPNADQLDTEALRNFFAANTTVGADAVTRMVNTFKALVNVGKFDQDLANDHVEEPISPDADKLVRVHKPASGSGMTVNINIQLQVPPDATGEIYDKFFESMKKHLFPEDK